MSSKIIHRTYRHIVNSNVGSYVRKHGSEVANAWVEEKIDGSNFYFVTDGVTGTVGKRHSLLEGSGFFSFQKIQGGIDQACSNFVKFYHEIHPYFPPEVTADNLLYLYGELIPTQKRIKYVLNEKVYFIAFELVVAYYKEREGEKEGEGEEERSSHLFSREIWESLLQKYGFLVNPVLFTGSLEDCLVYDVESAKSIVPRLLGYDHELPIEGVVIRSHRLIVKKKANAFREIETGHLKTKQDRDAKVQAVIDLLNAMLTISRLDNIISQIGDKMVPDDYRLSNTVVLDAIQEAKDDEESVIFQISKSKLNKIQKELAALFQPFVKTHMNWG